MAYMLRIDSTSDFWRRVKTKAASEGVTVRQAILAFLYGWSSPDGDGSSKLYDAMRFVSVAEREVDGDEKKKKAK